MTLQEQLIDLLELPATAGEQDIIATLARLVDTQKTADALEKRIRPMMLAGMSRDAALEAIANQDATGHQEPKFVQTEPAGKDKPAKKK